MYEKTFALHIYAICIPLYVEVELVFTGSYPQEMLRTVWKEEHFLANLIRNRKDQCLVFI